MVQEACVTTTQNKQSRLNSFVPNGTVTDARIMLALEIVLKKYFLNSCTYKNIFQLISYTLISLIFFIMLNKLSNNWLQWSKHLLQDYTNTNWTLTALHLAILWKYVYTLLW